MAEINEKGSIRHDVELNSSGKSTPSHEKHTHLPGEEPKVTAKAWLVVSVS